MTWPYIGLVAVAASVAFYIIECYYQPPMPHGCTRPVRSRCADICRGAAQCQVRNDARFCYCDEPPDQRASGHLPGAKSAETVSGQPCKMPPVAPTAVAFRRPRCDCRGRSGYHTWGAEGCVRP